MPLCIEMNVNILTSFLVTGSPQGGKAWHASSGDVRCSLFHCRNPSLNVCPPQFQARDLELGWCQGEPQEQINEAPRVVFGCHNYLAPSRLPSRCSFCLRCLMAFFTERQFCNVVRIPGHWSSCPWCCRCPYPASKSDYCIPLFFREQPCFKCLKTVASSLSRGLSSEGPARCRRGSYAIPRRLCAALSEPSALRPRTGELSSRPPPGLLHFTVDVPPHKSSQPSHSAPLNCPIGFFLHEPPTILSSCFKDAARHGLPRACPSGHGAAAPHR